MTTKRQTKLQNMQAHVTTALDGQLHEGEIIESMAAEGQMWMTHFFELARLFGIQPRAYLIVTNQRVLIAKLAGRIPAKDIAKVQSGTIVEQRPRLHDEAFVFNTTARELHEPGRTIGLQAIRVEDWLFTPSFGWQFVG